MYNTDIVTIDKSKGIITLDNGGWATATTKVKINQIIKHLLAFYACIYQEKGIWYYTYKTPKSLQCLTSINISFFNGMKLDFTGKVLNPSKGSKVLNKKARLIKLIDKYCDKLKSLKTLPLPGTGDCWYCSMFEQAGSKDNAHLLKHLKEKYVHGSLIMAALKARGYNDPGMIFHLGAQPKGSMRGPIIQAVKVYFKTRLGIAR